MIQNIIIVGTGFAGLGLGAQLKRNTGYSFMILERAGDVGGAWRDNTYPGAACDVPSHLYSFSFRPNPNWSHVYSPQSQIFDYLKKTAKEEGLLEHIRFHADVTAADWNEELGVWTVVAGGETYIGRTLILASGRLSDPKMPDIPGIESFEGKLFHSAAWAHDYTVEGLRVGVIGTGASAIQIIPEMANTASHLTVFQRSAAYVRPRVNRQYTEVEKREFARSPESMSELREELFWANESRLVERQALPALLERAAGESHAHREAQVEDPEVREKLRPHYVFGCKRALRSSDYYPTFNLPHVELQTSGIARIEGNRVIARDGQEHELDVLVAATGFEATDLPISYHVRGIEGELLSDRWKTGMQAFATTSVNGFPNMFLMGGPNTGLGHNSAIYIIESQVSYLLGALDHVLSTPGGVMEVSRENEEQFIRGLESSMEGTVWLSEGCETWYVDSRNGRLTSLWPDFAHSFRRQNGYFDATPYVLRRKGEQSAAVQISDSAEELTS